jgi:hypothetical protein
MSTVLKKACTIIEASFKRVYDILKQKDIKSGFEIKIMVYRNYNSPVEEILESTSFENTPEKLQQFLRKVGASGGWGNEAI